MFECKNKILRILSLCISSSTHSGNKSPHSSLSCSNIRSCALITSLHWPKITSCLSYRFSSTSGWTREKVLFIISFLSSLLLREQNVSFQLNEPILILLSYQELKSKSKIPYWKVPFSEILVIIYTSGNVSSFTCVCLVHNMPKNHFCSFFHPFGNGTNNQSLPED